MPKTTKSAKRSPQRSGGRKATPTRKRKAKAAHKASHVPGRITLSLDNKHERIWNRNSLVEEIRNMPATEAQLVAQACSVSGYTPEALAREGLHLMAQRLIAGAASKKDSTRGVAGAADERIAAAIEACKRDGIPLTPARIGARAEPKVGIRTVTRYMQRHGIAPASDAR